MSRGIGVVVVSCMMFGDPAIHQPCSAAGAELIFTDIFRPGFDDGFIRSVATDGSGLREVLKTGPGLRSVALDQVDARIYWSDVDDDAIRRMKRDGSDPEDLITENLAFPLSIALNQVEGKLYWGDQSLDRIGYANLDGSGATTWLSTPFNAGLAVDAQARELYWSVALSGSEGEILRRSLDGGPIDTVVSGIGKPRRIALDPDDGRIYWTDVVNEAVRRSDLDGGNVELLYTNENGLDPGGLTLDLESRKLYWAQETSVNRMTIMRMNLNGSVPEEIVRGFGIVSEIAFASSTNRCPADLNTDSIVDIEDLRLVLMAWGNAGGPADLDGSGVVDFVDLIVVLVSWGACP